MFSDQDFAFMRRALELAALGLNTTTPNPRVGCVLVNSAGEIVGQGWHKKAGEPHAEALALANAGTLARGATAYVTLEPCSHTGRTPPCADALIRAGIARVIAAQEDPNPLVSGRGLEKLRQAGIDVRCGLLQQEAEALNPGFNKRMRQQRPWVRLKTAISLDGRIALPNGTSQWITGPQARADGHAWRARACAILTGVGTVKEDDPQLTVRDTHPGSRVDRQPLRVVVDSRLETPLNARLVNVSKASNQLEAPTLVAHLSRNAEIEKILLARGVELLFMDQSDPNKVGKLDLDLLLAQLAQRGLNEIHLEAGAKLNASFLSNNLVDELLVYQAPIILGDGPSFAPITVPTDLAQLRSPHRWTLVSQTQLGVDQRLIFQRPEFQRP